MRTLRCGLRLLLECWLLAKHLGAGGRLPAAGLLSTPLYQTLPSDLFWSGAGCWAHVSAAQRCFSQLDLPVDSLSGAGLTVLRGARPDIFQESNALGERNALGEIIALGGSVDVGFCSTPKFAGRAEFVPRGYAASSSRCTVAQESCLSSPLNPGRIKGYGLWSVLAWVRVRITKIRVCITKMYEHTAHLVVNSKLAKRACDRVNATWVATLGAGRYLPVFLPVVLARLTVGYNFGTEYYWHAIARPPTCDVRGKTFSVRNQFSGEAHWNQKEASAKGISESG